MKNFDLSRFKNYGLWVSILALIPLILNAFGVTVIPDQYQVIANTILSILVAGGVLNNPTTTTKWFGDDLVKKETIEENK